MKIYFSKNLEVIISRELGKIFIHELFLENYHQIYASAMVFFGLRNDFQRQ